MGWTKTSAEPLEGRAAVLCSYSQHKLHPKVSSVLGIIPLHLQQERDKPRGHMCVLPLMNTRVSEPTLYQSLLWENNVSVLESHFIVSLLNDLILNKNLKSLQNRKVIIVTSPGQREGLPPPLPHCFAPSVAAWSHVCTNFHLQKHIWRPTSRQSVESTQWRHLVISLNSNQQDFHHWCHCCET